MTKIHTERRGDYQGRALCGVRLPADHHAWQGGETCERCSKIERAERERHLFESIAEQPNGRAR